MNHHSSRGKKHRASDSPESITVPGELLEQLVMTKFFVSVSLCLFLGARVTTAQAPGTDELNRAYQALRNKDYDPAVTLFRQGLLIQPQNASAHKDLAYTLLKAGENADARDEFAAAAKLDPKDDTAALEFAFLAYETKQPIEARRVFDRLRHDANPNTRAIAEHAFQNIDRPLADGIARWKQAIGQSARSMGVSMYSAHWELAQLAELRDELPLAAQQYEICRQLKPQVPDLLIVLARVWNQLDRREEAHAALLAASRLPDSRTAELAFEQLGPRYPYPYEFINALRLDPQNVTLRSELAYLYLAMGKKTEAVAEFDHVLQLNPNNGQVRDQLDALRGFKKRMPQPEIVVEAKQPPVDAKTMGKKSLALGYSKDALRYLREAYEQHPSDAEVMLQLGWAYNLVKDDAEAIHWFNMARHSGDPAIAAQASQAYRNLTGETAAQTTVWALPMYSSRWNDLFTYGQIKHSFLLPLDPMNRPLTFYASTRFIGDVKSSLAQPPVDPQYFSESSFIVGLGVSSRTWHHLMGWAEAGEAVKYLPGRHDVGAAIPDYRGGLNYTKGFGHLLGSDNPGLFYETVDEAIYVSRFQKDWLFFSRHRAGRSFDLGQNNAQLLFNVNYVRDSQNQYWANTLELGPGLKLRASWMPRNVYFSTDFLRGVYLNNLYNPRRPNYYDIRVGFWFAITK